MKEPKKAETNLYILNIALFFLHQGMKCLITYTKSTEGEDFYGEGADAKVPELGSAGVTLDKIFGPMKEGGVDAEILVGVKDEVVTA